MSWLKRLFGRSEAEVETEPPPEPPVASEPEDSEPLGVPDDPALQLEALGDDPQPTLDEPRVLELIDRVRASGREARAIDLARRILANHTDARAVSQRVAEILASRGDDHGAADLVAPFVDAPDAPLDLCMLAAEIAERRGDERRALALYERVVARDLDYPRARARVRRLREGERHARDLGATLMTDGALTRGRYRVERELGRGGAGTVFLADDLSLGRKVALKVYHRRGRSERERLLVEARTPANLEHPGVVRIFDLDESLAAIAMERVLGGSVRREMEKGKLTVERIRVWFHTAADALAHVHERGFVHRDFKPSNMLLRSDDRVVLTDFGVACAAGWVPAKGAAMAEGTLAYMAPEHRAGAPAHPSMDVHAVGVALKEVLEHASTEPPAFMRECASACVRRDPAQRPNAAWVAEQLEGR
ncbi:MAG: serine/threonine protein kinase [Sandaracinaceae bacterium]|nr:serine/threonine protein kinase [Sandaracinaceae bacterium]